MKDISRREFLRLGTLTGAGMALAACAAPVAPPAAAPEATKPPEAAPTTAPAAASAGKQTLEMWMWETEPRWKNVEATSGLNEKFPDVEFKWTALPFDQLHDKAIVSLAAGSPEGLPDIIRTYIGFLLKMTKTGSLADVTETVTPYKNDILPERWEQIDYQGKIYHVPDDTGVTLWGYRWDIFEAAGLPSKPEEVEALLKTYDDMIEVAKQIEAKTGAKAFNMGANGAGGVFDAFARQDTTGNFDKEGNVLMDDAAHVAAASAVKRIWDAKITTDLDGPVMWQAYKDKKLSMMRYPNWQDFVIVDSAPETKGMWRVCKLPMVAAGGKRAHTDDGCCLCIPDIIAAERKDLAIKVAEYMKLTTKATVAHMKEFSGAFVTYVPGLEAMKDQPSPILDGQFVYPIYLAASQTEDIYPWYRTSVYFDDANKAENDAMFKILTENAPIEATLKEAADSIRKLQESSEEK
jgi:ABC-type glycerol-3-phosphate transport system substrate-binding protein